jgi:hypothetical protein
MSQKYKTFQDYDAVAYDAVYFCYKCTNVSVELAVSIFRVHSQ